MTMFNQAFGMWVNRIGEFVKDKYNWTQNAASVIQERNAACEDMTLSLQGQLGTLKESTAFKWFSWLLPEVPRFEDCRAVASQDGFLGRWLQRCPWIGGYWKAREELRGCELGLQQMKEEALRFNDQLQSNWFFGKLLPEFNIGGREEILSHGNRTFYIGLAAAGVIFGGVMVAWRRMTKEGEDAPELDGEDLKTDYLDRTTLVENLEEENSNLQGQLNELRRKLDEMNAEKAMQEKLIAQKVTENHNLKIECAEKVKEQGILNTEMEERKSEDAPELDGDLLKTDCLDRTTLVENLEEENRNLQGQLNELRRELDEMNAEKAMQEKLIAQKVTENHNLKIDCAEKVKEQGILNTEMEEMKSEDAPKLDGDLLKTDCLDRTTLVENLEEENRNLQGQLNELRRKLDEMNAERELQEKLIAQKVTENHNLKIDCAEKVKEQEKKQEILNTEMEEMKKIYNEKIENLENHCIQKDFKNKEQEKLLDILKSENEKNNKVQNEKTKVQNKCNEKDIHIQEQEKMFEDLKTENENLKKMQDQKTEQLNQLRGKIKKFKAEKDEQEKLRANIALYYQNLEKVYKRKDLEMKEQNKLLENLRAENGKLKKMQNQKTEVNQLRKEINELKREKEEQENLRGKIALYYQFLEKVYERKDLQLKKQRNLLDKIRKEKGETKKMQNQQAELNKLRNEIEELKTDKEEKEKQRAKMATYYQNLEKAFNKKELQMKEQIKSLKNLKGANGEMKEMQDQKTELNQLRSQINELNREKEEQEDQRAQMESDYQNLEKAYNEKHLEMEELKQLLEDLNTENNGPEELQEGPVNDLINEIEELKAENEERVRMQAKIASDYENLKNECDQKDDQLKRQEKLLELLKTGNKGPKKLQRDQVNVWKKKVDELNAEKEEREKLNAKIVSDYQNLLRECAMKDREMERKERLLEILKIEKEEIKKQKEQLKN
ncbi:golgin subfamily A member 6-like protein 25 [Palaemon carinicauda]|uniref:golgin subfamily A member 6-like protein 25 n=1 Tax=Palaemon carinicauda TaxID=392227 RepID=UPI0035B637CE